MVAARRIGLTGGIASGKSSVGRLLAARGLPLLDADVYAREALAPGSPGAGAVLERYGDGVPLLFEAGLETLCSEVWLVDCDETQQLQRLMARDCLGEADARARIAAQWPLARKRQLADVVLDNRGGPEQLAAQVEQALSR